MYFIVAIIMALRLLVLGAPIGHGHRDGHASTELHRRVIDIVEATKTVFTTVTVTVAPSMTPMHPQEGTSTTLPTLASSTTVATQKPTDTNPAPFRTLVPEAYSAIILNSCATDVYVSSVGDASCGPGTNLQLMRPYTTYREEIRVCDKGGIALKVSKKKDMSRPMQFEYAVWGEQENSFL
ncbi:BYS1 domain-containing [Pyrenophora seminiperda CCB06]|uniref:BYS1 domain-containing n=1 Tax=Pyrenophora seminiperda CCB06 TaxID=1302712 RepID=A0A3M7M9S1_9PLEO|nr:BYS1 domain-containing [Pyrenophora seminiperda CCB06]